MKTALASKEEHPINFISHILCLIHSVEYVHYMGLLHNDIKTDNYCIIGKASLQPQPQAMFIPWDISHERSPRQGELSMTSSRKCTECACSRIETSDHPSLGAEFSWCEYGLNSDLFCRTNFECVPV
ncbi:unnamed protein product [Owenia fusiformis]|uniref:Protein kinase domain-containing protein n=1 Tax=Owenia fusiformis TaxID=6347 RepID=A0A8S4NCC7_OWEFU|nr:unnamed protein product [Owenia fusiformis]